MAQRLTASRAAHPSSVRKAMLAAVLFDRDGTLIADVPYNGNPEAVVALPGAAEALQRLRAQGVAVGLVSNQSGIGRGLLSIAQVRRVNRRVAQLLGPFQIVVCCPHVPSDRCRCRKPKPGMVLHAARVLGVAPTALAVVGDIGADVDAAQAAGAQAVLVPTAVTKPDEIAAAPAVAADLPTAVTVLLRRRAALCSVGDPP